MQLFLRDDVVVQTALITYGQHVNTRTPDSRLPTKRFYLPRYRPSGRGDRRRRGKYKPL